MRVDNWPKVLAEKIEEWRFLSFDWSRNDCCQFAADVVMALTGTDYRDRFPTYASREEAETILTGLGGIPALASSVLGESKHPAMAKRGDVIACDFGEGVALGICLGVECCAPGQKGLVFRPTLSSIAAWDV